MKKLGLLAALVLSITGCASTGTGTGMAAKKAQVDDSYTPVGSFIPRKSSDRGATNAREISGEELELDRLSNPVNIPTGGM